MCFGPPENIPSGSSMSLLSSPDPSNCLGLLISFDETSDELSVENSFKAVNVHNHIQHVLLCDHIKHVSLSSEKTSYIDFLRTKLIS